MDTRTHDELSVMLNQEEYDDISVAESLVNDNQRDTESLTQVIIVIQMLALLSYNKLHETHFHWYFASNIVS